MDEKLKKALKAGEEANREEVKVNMPFINMIPGDTIKVRYAPLPVRDTAVRYMVQVMTPVSLVVSEKIVTHSAWVASDENSLKALKKMLLDE